jgi:hypothetical protein
VVPYSANLIRLTVLFTLSKARRNKEKKTHPNLTMKVTTKCGETVIPDDPRVGICLGTVPEPGGFNSDVAFDDVDPPEITTAAS